MLSVTVAALCVPFVFLHLISSEWVRLENPSGGSSSGLICVVGGGGRRVALASSSPIVAGNLGCGGYCCRVRFRSPRWWLSGALLPVICAMGGVLHRLFCFTEVDQQRESEQIDRALLKNVLDIFVEIGMGQMEYYENHFELSMLKDTATYYSRKASNWILEDSCPYYMLKSEECLKREKDRVFHYLHVSSEPKLLEQVQHELLSVYATQLLEKEHSGCHALLRDDKGLSIPTLLGFNF